VKAILELEHLGFTFTLEGESIHYTHDGHRPDPEFVRPLLDYLKRHRDEAVCFLQERKTSAAKVTARPAVVPEPGYPITLIWPADIKGVGVMEGQWRRLATGEIKATYPTRESLALATAPVLAECDGSPEWAQELAKALQRWPDDPPPMTPCRPLGAGEHRRFWRRLDKWVSGWICAICHPPPPGVEVEVWEVPI
jgi:hypothetical protein